MTTREKGREKGKKRAQWLPGRRNMSRARRGPNDYQGEGTGDGQDEGQWLPGRGGLMLTAWCSNDTLWVTLGSGVTFGPVQTGWH